MEVKIFRLLFKTLFQFQSAVYRVLMGFQGDRMKSSTERIVHDALDMLSECADSWGSECERFCEETEIIQNWRATTGGYALSKKNNFQVYDICRHPEQINSGSYAGIMLMATTAPGL
jgi:hypothetical protein